MKKLQSLQEVSQLINEGRLLSLAGDQRVLSKLPKGQWLGGSTPYFMDEERGKFNQEAIYVDDFSDTAIDHKIMMYTPENLSSMTDDRFYRGFTFLVIPAFSTVHSD